MATRLNIGLIGAGRIGRMHAGHLTHRVRGASLIAVADPNSETAERAAADFAIATSVTDYHDLLDDARVDAVVICSSTDTHATIIAEAARAGKAIFCEKPIALTLPEIDTALAAVARAGVQLQIGFNRRFDASFKRVRAAVAEGEIGQPWLLRITSRDPAPPPISYIRSSGGLFLDMTIHDFDMARFVIGAEVQTVSATAGVLVSEEIGAAGDIDTAVVVLRFANGVIGTIENSRQAVYGYDQRIEVLGGAGAVSIDNTFPNQATISTADAIRRDPPHHFFLERYAASYVDEMIAFVDAVRQNRTPVVTGSDGRAPVVLALAAERSARTGRVVAVAEIEGSTEKSPGPGDPAGQ